MDTLSRHYKAWCDGISIIDIENVVAVVVKVNIHTVDIARLVADDFPAWGVTAEGEALEVVLVRECVEVTVGANIA